MRTTRKRLNGIMMCHDHDHWIWATWTVCSLQTAKTVRFLPDSKEGVTRLVGARLRGKHRACNVVLVALIYCMPGSKCWYYVLLSCSVHCCKLYISVLHCVSLSGCLPSSLLKLITVDVELFDSPTTDTAELHYQYHLTKGVIRSQNTNNGNKRCTVCSK